jgi:NodT family efflux transporter outer membrane factor (OMF) lipoprotein
MHNKYLILLFFLLGSCKMYEYNKPTSIADSAPETFLEEGIKWRQAKPNANYDRGEWWKMYNDATLNELEKKLNSNNQTIISAEQTYKSSLALVKVARSSYFPTINANQNLTRRRTQAENGIDYSHNNSQLIELSSSWELDVYNAIGYQVDSRDAQAQSDKNNWIYTRLSQQTSLAQYYFSMRALDINQRMLDNIVIANKSSLKYGENRAKSGVIDQLGLIPFQTSYYTAVKSAEDNKILRARYQHAIAVLIAESPSTFIIPANYNVDFSPIYVPLMLPSDLLERRPDVAQAENLVKQANANLGLVSVAYFPVLSIVGTAQWNTVNNNYGPLFSMPQLLWSVGPQLAMTLFDGGGFLYQKESAKYSYDSQVSSYRSTVLSAFQEVEDQLSSVKIYTEEIMALQKNVEYYKEGLDVTNNQYKQGIVDYNEVLTAQVDYYNAVIVSSSVKSLQKVSEITLIKVLGGGWTDEDKDKDKKNKEAR